MWEEKERGEELKLLWGKVKMARPRRPNQKSCNLCNQETGNYEKGGHKHTYQRGTGGILSPLKGPSIRKH